MGGAGTFASCYGHNCDPSSTIYGRNPGEGEAIDENTWESSPTKGDAISYSRERTIFFEMKSFTDRIPVNQFAYVSAEQNVVNANGNETQGSGNLAEWSGFGPGTIALRNDTCADYFVRVVVEFAPVGAAVPAVPVTDAGAEEDAADAQADQ